MTDLSDLIARIEGEARGSRALDCLIAKQAGWFRYTREKGCTMKHGGWIAPEDFRGTDSQGAPILDGLHGTTIHRDPPSFTRSLDAAVSLVPEGWQGNGGLLWPGRDNGVWVNHAKATLKHDLSSGGAPRVIAYAATPALALCAASLRARESER